MEDFVLEENCFGDCRHLSSGGHSGKRDPLFLASCLCKDGLETACFRSAP